MPNQLVISAAQWISVLSIVAGLVTLMLQVRERRKDDKLAAQLTRLNRQLSELYGPLYALYEAGERNWLQFIATHSFDDRPLRKRTFIPGPSDRFLPPTSAALGEYRRRMEQLFMPTNGEMESAIARHADLIVGTRMPDSFSDFLAHVAAARLLMHSLNLAGAHTETDWKEYRINYPHPPELKHLVRASFEVLKKVQQEVLTGKLKTVDEANIEHKIWARARELADDWERSEPSYAATILHSSL